MPPTLTKGSRATGTLRCVDAPHLAVSSLLDAEEHEREAWARDQPADPNAWLHLLVAVDHRYHGTDADLPRLVELHLWLLQAAERAAALRPDETTVRTAMLVARVRATAPSLEAVAAVPSSDTVVARCLAPLPRTPDDLPDRDALLARLAGGDPTALDAARRSRRAKNLVRAAALHQDHLVDPQLSNRLQCCIDALPRLV